MALRKMLVESAYKEKLGRKIAIWLIIFAVILAMSFTAFDAYRNYHKNQRNYSESINQSLNAALPIIARSIWLLDNNNVDISTQSLVQQPYVAGVRIMDDKGFLIAMRGDIPQQSNDVITRDIVYQDTINDKDIVIGQVNIFKDYQEINNQVYQLVQSSVLYRFIETLMTLIFLMFIVHHLVSRHLTALASSINMSFSENKEFELQTIRPIKLDRKTSNDELQLLTDTLNDNRERIIEHLNVINKNQKTLRQEVEARSHAEWVSNERNRVLDSFFEAVDRGMILLNNNWGIERLNPESRRLLNVENDDVNIFDILTLKLNVSDKNNNRLEELANRDEKSIFNGYCQTKDKQFFPCLLRVHPLIIDGIKTGVAITIQDKTDEQAIKEINYNANHDFLTGLHNRYSLEYHINKIMKNNDSASYYFLGFVDLDFFKLVNDTFGHSTGDDVLCRIAELLRYEFGKNAVIARLGGDEFVFLAPGNRQQIVTSLSR